MVCDASGEFAVNVIPAKSGVGGGILELSLRNMELGLWTSPGRKGNSIAGINILKV